MHKFIQRLFVCFFIFFNPSLFADQLIIEPDDGRAPILSAIQHANSSVSLVMYGMTDERFISALINAKNQGKLVQILLEPNPYKAGDENSIAIKQLQAAHVDLHWPDKQFKLTHQKTFLFDQKTALVMTFNLTHSTFNRERNFALLIDNPDEVQEIQQVFTDDWSHQNSKVQDANLVWSPDNSREKILDLIQNAKSSLQIYAQDISDYQIVGALAKAARRGVTVDIIMSDKSEKYKNKKLAYLRRAGARIKTNSHYYIHAKVMIIDHEQTLLGSINFTKSSLENNRELSVITKDSRVLKQLTETFEQDWQDGVSGRKPRNKRWSAADLLREWKHIQRALM